MKGSERHRLKENELSQRSRRGLSRACSRIAAVALAGRGRRCSSFCCWLAGTGPGPPAAKTARRCCSAMPSSSCSRRYRKPSPARSRQARQLPDDPGSRRSGAGEVHRGLQRLSVDRGRHRGALLRGRRARDAGAPWPRRRRDTRRSWIGRARTAFTAGWRSSASSTRKRRPSSTTRRSPPRRRS